MTHRPTTKAGIIASVGALLVVVATTAQAGWLFVLSAGVLGLVASGIFTSHRLASVTVTRSVPIRTRFGEDVTVTLSVHNSSSKRLPVMRVEDPFPALGEMALACESIPRGSSATLEMVRKAVHRGVYDGADVTLTTAAPFGLMRTRRTVAVPSRVIVHPAVVRMAGSLPETASVSADEPMSVTRSGAGDVFAGVREYRPGDQRRLIHWRTTARTGRLAVREHEEAARSPIVLVVAGFGSDHVAEHVASTAASVGLYALDKGRPVHCVGPGRFGDHVENATRVEVLDWAAALEPSDSTPEDAVAFAFRKWGRRCSFVLLEGESGFTRAAGELARRRGAGVEIVLATCPRQQEIPS